MSFEAEYHNTILQALHHYERRLRDILAKNDVEATLRRATSEDIRREIKATEDLIQILGKTEVGKVTQFMPQGFTGTLPTKYSVLIMDALSMLKGDLVASRKSTSNTLQSSVYDNAEVTIKRIDGVRALLERTLKS